MSKYVAITEARTTGATCARRPPPLPPPLPTPIVLHPTVESREYFSCVFDFVQNQQTVVGTIWNSGDVLLRYLELESCPLRTHFGPSRRIIELGAGVGHVGIAIAVGLKPREYMLTDVNIKPAQANLDIAMKQHQWLKSTVLRSFSLDWCSHPKNSPNAPHGNDYVDTIVAVDCVWMEKLYEPFLRWVMFLCGPNTTIVLAHEHRREDSYALVFKVLLDNDFLIRKVCVEDLTYALPNVALFTIRRVQHHRSHSKV